MYKSDDDQWSLTLCQEEKAERIYLPSRSVPTFGFVGLYKANRGEDLLRSFEYSAPPMHITAWALTPSMLMSNLHLPISSITSPTAEWSGFVAFTRYRHDWNHNNNIIIEKVEE